MACCLTAQTKEQLYLSLLSPTENNSMLETLTAPTLSAGSEIFPHHFLGSKKTIGSHYAYCLLQSRLGASYKCENIKFLFQ
jgi:hypothetical protein